VAKGAQGIVHAYVPLATLVQTSTAWSVTQDLRVSFRSLQASALTAVSGDANNNITISANLTVGNTGSLKSLTVNGTASVTGTLTAGGLATFSAGLTVPSGQTGTFGGGLQANGGLTVAAGQIAAFGGALQANAGITVANGQTATFKGPVQANGGLT